MMETEELTLTQEWDKTYPRDERAGHCKITFVNRYGITLAADMFVPRNAKGKLPAIAVSGPFGAVKEQVSLLSHLILPLPERAAARPAIWLLRISIQKTSRLR